jgi:gluconokinase
MIVLVLEASTSSAKAMLVDTENHTQQSMTQPYRAGTANNPQSILEQTLDVGARVAASQSVSMIALGTTWHGLLFCNEEMEVRSPLWNWSDTISQELCKQLRRDESYTQSFYKESGCMVHSIYPYFKLMHFKRQGILKKTDKIADQGSYMFYQLTGSWFTSPSLVSGMGFLDIHSKTYSKQMKSELGLSIESQLPKLVRFGTTAPLSRKAALRLGIKQGIPVLPCFPDGGLNQIGSDAIQSGIMTLSMGTSGAMRLTTEKPYLPQDMSSWCYLSPKEEYLSGAATSGCCNCVDWAKERFFSKETTYAEIEEQMDIRRQIPTYLPFLYGERCPGWNDERTASFHNLRPHHTPIDRYQAVLEGVVYNLYQCFLEIRESHFPIDTIKLSGGVLNSKAWKQMCCDIFNFPLTEDSATQSSLLGGAKLALECLGESLDINDFFVNNGTLLTPNEESVPFYQQRYADYLHWYEKAQVMSMNKE